jgi:membrane protein
MSYRGYWKRNWIQVFRRVWAEMLRDDVFGASAQLAYYFLLGFFPFLVFLVSLLAFIPLDEYLIRKSDLLLQIERLVDVMPPAAGELIQRTMESLATRKPALLSLGAAGALLAASTAMRPVMLILNRAWGVPEGRSFGKRYLLSLGLTLVFVVLVMAGAALLALSERISVWIASRFAPVWATLWRLGSLAAGYGALLLVVESIYHVAPNVRRPWRWITPGSVLAVLLWVVGVRVFSTYVTRFGAYEIMYGGLGAVVVFLLWLYIAGLAVLVGGELNAELERSAGIIAIVNVQPSPHDGVETRSMDGVAPDHSRSDLPPRVEGDEAGTTDRPG